MSASGVSVYASLIGLRSPWFTCVPSKTDTDISVGNVPYQGTEQDIGQYFSAVGNVTNVRIVYDRETGRPRGFAFVEFEDQTGADRAVQELNGAQFNGRNLRVNYANK